MDMTLEPLGMRVLEIPEIGTGPTGCHLQQSSARTEALRTLRFKVEEDFIRAFEHRDRRSAVVLLLLLEARQDVGSCPACT